MMILTGPKNMATPLGSCGRPVPNVTATLPPAYALDREGDLLAVQAAQLEEGVVVAGRRRRDEQVDGRLSAVQERGVVAEELAQRQSDPQRHHVDRGAGDNMMQQCVYAAAPRLRPDAGSPVVPSNARR